MHEAYVLDEKPFLICEHDDEKDDVPHPTHEEGR